MRLAGYATTVLAPTSFATEIGVIDLDTATKRVHSAGLHHQLHQLVAYLPRRVVGDARMAVQLDRRDAFLVMGDEGDGLEPHRERQLCGIEDGPGGDRDHAVAAIALLELAGVELAASVMATVRAKKSIRPLPLKEGVEALVFGSIERDEFAESDSFLDCTGLLPIRNPFFVIEAYGDTCAESIFHFEGGQFFLHNFSRHVR